MRLMTPKSSPACGHRSVDRSDSGAVTRRAVLGRTVGAGAALVAGDSLLQGCSSGPMPTDISVQQTKVDVSGKYSGDLAAAHAAEGDGRAYYISNPVHKLASQVTLSDWTSLFGKGAGPSSAATAILCTTRGAGLKVTGTGGQLSGFIVDGGNRANQPLLRYQGTARLFQDVQVINSAGDNWTIQSSQNDTYLGCQSMRAAGRGIVLDLGCGGLLFARFEVSLCAGSLLIQQTGRSPNGVYLRPQHVTFLHSIFERQGADTPAVEGTDCDHIFLVNSILTGKRDSAATQPTLKLSGTAHLTVTNCNVDSFGKAARFITLADSAQLTVQGRNFLLGGATRPAFDVDAPSGTYIYMQGELVSVGNAITLGPTTPNGGDQTLGQTLQTATNVYRSAATDLVTRSALAADAGIRFQLRADGQLGWADGTTFTPDVSLSRFSSGVLDVTGSLQCSQDSIYDLGASSLSWRTAAIRSIRAEQIPQALGVAGPVAIDPIKGDAAITLHARATSSAISAGASNGHKLTITWIQDATGGHSYAWPTNCKFAGAAPSDTTANKRTSVTFRFDGRNWYEESRAVAVG